MTWNLTSLTSARDFFDQGPISLFQTINQAKNKTGPLPMSYVPPAVISEFVLATGPGGGLTAAQKKTTGQLATTVQAILGEMAKPVNGGKGLTRSVTFPFTFSFKFPYRKTRNYDWKLWDFIMLKGTKVTYAIRYQTKGNIIFRKTSLIFRGPSLHNGGFWGPFKGDESGEKVFPDQRMDRIDLLEAFNAKDGKPVPHFKIKDYSRNKKKIPYKITIWVSLHDKKTGNNDGCSSLMGMIISKLAKAKCVNYRNEEALKFNFSRQVYSIFENMGNLKLHGSSNDILAEAKKAYAKTPSYTQGSNLAMIMGYLWQSGIVGGQKAFTSRINGMESKTPSKPKTAD